MDLDRKNRAIFRFRLTDLNLYSCKKLYRQTQTKKRTCPFAFQIKMIIFAARRAQMPLHDINNKLVYLSTRLLVNLKT